MKTNESRATDPQLPRSALAQRLAQIWRPASAPAARAPRLQFEAIEPRVLLSADFRPDAAAAMELGLDWLGDHLDDFLSDETLLDSRVPLLLNVRENQDGIVVDEAPTIRGLFTVPVDTNNSDSISGDEIFLQDLDNAGNGDGAVDAGEFLRGWFFDPVATFLDTQIGPGDETSEFETFLKGNALDKSLSLPGGITIDFEIINDDVDDTTEDPDAEVTFDVAFSLTITQDMPIDLGIEADALRLLPFTGPDTAPEPPIVGVSAALSFGFTFGVFTGGKADNTLTGADFFVRTAEPLLVSVTAEEAGLNFKLNVGFLGAQVVNGNFDLQADIETTLLDPNDPEVLGFVDTQHGAEQPTGVVVAANAVPDADLAHDAGFFLRIGNIGITTAVSVEADDNGDNLNNLLADVQGALADAQLDELIVASLEGGDTLKFSLVSTTDTPLGFANEILGLTGTLTATPPTFEPGATVTFLLSVGGALPALVSVRFPDPARDKIGFDANQGSSLLGLSAQGAADANGDIGGDGTAGLTIRVTASDGTPTEVALAVTEATAGPNPNTSDANLLADLNAAINASALNGKVSASLSGGVITLNPLGTTSAIEVTAADAEAQGAFGFGTGQQSTQRLVAANAVSDASLSDGNPHTSDEGHIEITVVTTGGTTTTELAIAPGSANGAALASLIDAALGNAGLDIDANFEGGHIVLTAQDASVLDFSINTVNDDIDELVNDVDRALGAAGLGGQVSASTDGTNLTLTSAGGASLEISRTLTFDAGVTGTELLLTSTADLFSPSTGADSHASFALPVKVLQGLRDPNTGTHWNPADVAIVGNFDPFGPLSVFDDGELRFNLNLTVDPANASDAPIAVPTAASLTDEIKLVNFAELLQFNVVSAESMVGLVTQLGQALDSIAQAGQYALYGIPFSGAALADLLVYGEMVQTELVYDFGVDGELDEDPAKANNHSALTTDGERSRLLLRTIVPSDGDDTVELLPAFVTAQQLAARLSTLLDIPLGEDGINASYNPNDAAGTGNELSYAISLRSQDRISVGVDEAFESPFEFDLPLAPFSELTVDTVPASAKVSLKARTSLDLTFGVDLDPVAPIDYTSGADGTLVADLNNQTGVDIKLERAVTGEDPVRRVFGISSDASFGVRIDGGATVPVTLSKATVDATSGSLDALRDALEDAINGALSGTTVSVTVAPDEEGKAEDRLRVTLSSGGTTIDLIPDANDPSALIELGFDPDAPAAGTLTARASAPGVYALTANASFIINVSASSLGVLAGKVGVNTPVSVDASATAGNRSIAELVADVNNALRGAGLLVLDGGVEKGVRAEFDAGRLVLTGTDTSTAFSVAVTAGNKAETELGLKAGSTAADLADLIVIDRNGVEHRVSLDSADGDKVFDLLGALSKPGFFEATQNAAGTGLRLTDLTAGPMPDARPAIRVATVNGSLAALKLGFLANPTNPDDADNPAAGQPAGNPDFIEGASIGTQSLPDRFFARDARLGGGFTMELPGGGAAGDALVGIVGVDLSMSGGLGGEVTAHLQAPGGAPGSKVTLAQIQDRIGSTSPAQQIATDPVVSRLHTLNYDGQALLFDEFTPGALLTGDTSGARAIILAVDDNGFDGTGTLTLFNIDGDFQDDEVISDSETGEADANDTEAQETYFGEFELDFAVKPGLDNAVDAGVGADLEAALNGLTGTIPVKLTGFGDLQPDLDPIAPAVTLVDLATNLGALHDFVNLGYDDLAGALEELEGLVLTLEEQFAFLDQTLPLVNTSVGKLLSLSQAFSLSVNNFRDVIDEASALLDPAETDVPTLTLQGIAQALRGAFGLPDDSTGVIVDLEDGMLTIDLDLLETISTTLGLDVELVEGAGLDQVVLPNLTSGKILQVAGELGVGFKIGIDLADPSQVYLFNPDGGIEGSLAIDGIGAEGLGLVFQAMVGEVPVIVRDGLVDIDVEFVLGGLDFSLEATPGRKLLSLVGFDDFEATVPVDSFNASIPLFDPEAGLTGFIGEIAALGDHETISLPDLGDLADVLDGIASTLPDFNPLDNLLLLSDNVDFFLEILQDFFDLELFDIQLPLIGSNLSDGARFIEEFRDAFINRLRDDIESATDIQVGDITSLIGDFFSGFGDGIDVTGLAADFDLDNVDFEERYAEWRFTLGDTLTIPFDLDFDLGVPVLNMDVDIPLEISIEWSLNIGIGVSFAEGAYVLLDDDDEELAVTVEIDLPASETFRGTLGFLELIVDNQGSGAFLEFAVDLENTGGGERLGISDLGSLEFTPLVEGGKLDGNDHVLDFDLTVGIAGVATVFPNVNANFVLDWALPQTELGDLSGDALAEGLTLIALNDISIDAGSFLNDFLGKTLGEITKFTEPFEPIIQALTTPIPILSDLAKEDITLLDLAGVFGEVDTGFIDWIETVLDVIHVINEISDGTSLSIEIGDLKLYDDVGGAGAVLDKSSLFDPDQSMAELVPTGALGGAVQKAFDTFNDALAGANTGAGSGDATEAKSALTRLREGDLAELIEFPFLDDPMQIVGLLLGHDATLITLDAPRLLVGFDYTQVFPIFGPLAATVGLGFDVGIDFSFGFDTYGIRRFAEGGFTNPALILDGFFLGDREDITEGADINELFFEFNLTVTAELNLAIARAGAGVQGTAFIGLDLFDPDNDGAIHISELVNTIENQLRGDDPGLAPLSIFDLTGALTLELFAFLIIDFGVFELEYEFPITPEIEVFTFEFGFERPPILGTDLDNGTLQLNMGPNSIDRLNGDTSDGNEEFHVRKVANGIELWSPPLGVNSPQLYKGDFDHIVGSGGQGNDKIILEGFDESGITFEFDGGVGNDTIQFLEDATKTPATGAGAVIHGGEGNDILIGSHLDDLIVGGEGNDRVEGGRGYDLLFGDVGTVNTLANGNRVVGQRVGVKDGDDKIYGGSSTDTDLADQDADDILVGGGGDDELHGDGGSDVLLADGGRVLYGVTGGHIDVSTLRPAPFVPNDMLDPTPVVTTSQKIENLYADLMSQFSGTDLGAGGNDQLFGGAGGDFLFGGSGDDEIEGGDGDDYAVGGLGFDTLRGGAHNDALFGNAQNDTMEGNGGNDVMSGGFGDDVMHGNAGDDFMIGGRGLDVMYGDENNDEVWGEGEPDVLFGGIGNDLVVGGVGADIMFGDDGIVAKLDPDDAMPFNDVKVGIGNPALITAAMRTAADNSAGSLDLILTDAVAQDGNDIMSGNAGGDIMLGGGGDDVMGGDVDPRLAVANTPTVTTESGRDVLIGDGGIVQFDKRRLQRIASVVDNDPASFRDTIYGDNGNDVIIGGQGADGGNVPGNNVLGVPFQLAGGHGPGRGATDAEVTDDDIIIGDNGELLYADNTIAANFGRLEMIRTTDVANATGGADTAYGELGDDIILGGVNGSVDILHGSAGNDVILGDNGELDFAWGQDTADPSDDDANLDTLDLIRSYRDGWGGTDEISGSIGDDVLIGGTGGDQMYGDDAGATNGALDGEDVMLGDNGDIVLINDPEFVPDGEDDDLDVAAYGRLLVRVGDMPYATTVDRIRTTDTNDDFGGADTMSGNAKADIMLGGVNDGGEDTMYGDRAVPTLTTIADDGDDILLGDNGELDFTFAADTDRNTLDLIRSYEDGLGGTDVMSGNKGLDVAIGGTGDDEIYGDDGTASAADADLGDLLLGDNADVFLADAGGAAGGDLKLVLDAAVFRIRTTDEDHATTPTGGEDTISGNAGGDIIAGGVEGDTLYGDREDEDGTHQWDGADVLLGDNGAFEWLSDGRLDEIHGIDVAANNEALYDWFTDDDDPNVATVDADLTTLDLVTTEQRANGGRDFIRGDDGDDFVFGGTDADDIYGDDGELEQADATGGDDLLFGDHGRIYPHFSALAGFNSRNFFAIDTGDTTGIALTTHGGEGDRMWGEEGADSMLGQQGDDRMWGGSGDDDMTGGHNVAGGYDELSAPAISATLNPAVNDLMDGGSGDDAMAGDNAIVWRRGDDLSPRFRDLTTASIYTTTAATITANVDMAPDNDPADWESDPDDAVGRDIELLDHSDAVQAAPQGRFGDDVMAGGAHSDAMFGQLGNDLMQGDGAIEFAPEIAPFISRFLAVTDTGSDPDTDATLYFNIRERLSDADDYMEGSGGEDLMYGGLGQDDMIGGSSALFGLAGSETLRPDGSDRMFGGAGIAIARNDIGATTFGLTVIDTTDADGDPADQVITTLPGGHALDADFMMGDNANVFRLVEGEASGTNADDPLDAFLQFNYDALYGGRIKPRAMQQLDYTLGGADYAGGTYTAWGAANADNGKADLMHGESGDDVMFGMTGSDVMFGEGQDDDLVGGYGHDWISGGTGQDGVLGDDGLVYTSRNSTAGEPLYGVAPLLAANQDNPKYSQGDVLDELIATPGDIQMARINVSGELKKAADLVPFSMDPLWNAMDDEFPDNENASPYADDIIFGGLGSDWLHGGSGDDAISGAEALASAHVPVYNASGVAIGTLDLGYGAVGLPAVQNQNPGNVLAFNNEDLNGEHLNNRFRAGEFVLYDEYDPLRRIELKANGELWKPGDGAALPFLLNFAQGEGVVRPGGMTPGNQNQSVPYGEVRDDGKDSIFGDLGNDWLVGGTGRDNVYGGWGNDLLNADDDHSTFGDEPKHGGALTEGANDVPDTHPYYEDRAYGGAGRDVLIGNTGGDRLIDWVGEYNSYLVPYAPFGQASVSRTMMPHLHEFLYALSSGDGADPTRFNDTGADPERNGEPDAEMGLVLQKDFAWGDQTGAPSDPQAGNIPGGKRDVLRTANFNDGTLAGFSVDSGAWTVANAALKVSAESLGQDATGIFTVDEQLPGYYEVLSTVSVTKPTAGWKANSYIVFDYFDQHDFKFAGINVSTNKFEVGYRDATGWHVAKDAPKMLKADTFYNLMVAVNGTNVTLAVDNKIVLSHTFAPRSIDGYDYSLNLGLVGLGSDNSRGTFDNFTVQRVPPAYTLQTTQDFSTGVGALFDGLATGAWQVVAGRYEATGPAMSLADLGLGRGIETGAIIELSAVLRTGGAGGFVFDRYGADDYKFVSIDAVGDKVLIGHVSPKSGLTIDASFARAIDANVDYTLTLTLKGTSASVSLNGQAVGGKVFNAVTVDGDFGLLADAGRTSFDTVTLKTSDRAFADGAGFLLAEGGEGSGAFADVSQSALETAAAAAVDSWTLTLGEGDPRLATLGEVRITSADLVGAALGFAIGDIVYIDSDAAGYGWSAGGTMDLVTAVTHEFGHVLGFGHEDGGHAVMAATLASETRDGSASDLGGARFGEQGTGTRSGASLMDALGNGATFGLPGFDLERSTSAGISGVIDWQGGLADAWSGGYAPLGGGKPKEAAANFADYLVKLAAGKAQASGFDSLGSALLGKRGKAGR